MFEVDGNGSEMRMGRVWIMKRPGPLPAQDLPCPRAGAGDDGQQRESLTHCWPAAIDSCVGGDTDEPVVLPSAEHASAVELQDGLEGAPHQVDAALGVVADGRDVQRVVAHAAGCDERGRW
jgi:hypothetical protein